MGQGGCSRRIADSAAVSYVVRMKAVALAFIILTGCDATRAPGSANLADDHKTRSAEEPKPSVRLVDVIESQVRKLPCVGDLSRWDRDYRYDFRGPQIDTTMVLFAFVPAEDKPGRHISQPHDTYSIPTGRYRLVAGVYNTSTDTVEVEQCGDLADGPIQ